MQADPTDDELARLIDEAEFAEAAGHIEKAEEYAALIAEVKRRRLRHKRLRARRYADETEGEYLSRLGQEKLERHRTMPYPDPPHYGLYDPSHPRNNLWGQRTPRLVSETQHFFNLARDWMAELRPIRANFNTELLSVENNYSRTNPTKVDSVTWVGYVRNGYTQYKLRVLHNPVLNGERSIIFLSGDSRTYQSKHALW